MCHSWFEPISARRGLGKPTPCLTSLSELTRFTHAGDPIAACREPAGKLWQLCKVLYVFEHKMQYPLIHASFACIVVFWHISNIPLWYHKHLIVGDFNFYVNTDTDVDAKKFKSLLHQFDLIQHVNVPTHTAGNTLDLVISRGDISVKDICTDLSVRSDHFAVLFTLSSPSPGSPKQTVTYRS